MIQKRFIKLGANSHNFYTTYLLFPSCNGLILLMRVERSDTIKNQGK